MMSKYQKGFTLIDVLVSTMLVSLVLAGTLKSLALQTEMHSREDLSLMLDQNLRRAMDELTDELRAGGDGVPTENLSAWAPWVSGFTSNPKIDTSGDTAKLTIARCTSLPVMELSNTASDGDTHVVVTPLTDSNLGTIVNAYARRWILIGDSETAILNGRSGTQLNLDTDPTVNGQQGLKRGYPVGTPVCRINVTTYKLLNVVDGRSMLVEDHNDGVGWKSIAEGITDLQITTLEAGRRYRITLTATSEASDPLSGTDLTRTISSVVMVRNADAVSG